MSFGDELRAWGVPCPLFDNQAVTALVEGAGVRLLRQPDEIVGAIVFLASHQASAITGVVLPVDGGWTAGEPALPW